MATASFLQFSSVSRSETVVFVLSLNRPALLTPLLHNLKENALNGFAVFSKSASSVLSLGSALASPFAVVKFPAAAINTITRSSKCDRQTLFPQIKLLSFVAPWSSRPAECPVLSCSLIKLSVVVLI